MHLSGIPFFLCVLLVAIGGWSTNAARILSAQAQLSGPSQQPPPKLISFTEGQFVVDFACDSDKPGLCDNATKAIRSACRRIQTQLKFKRPVKAIMVMHKPCGSAVPNPSCLEMTAVGEAGPTHFLPVKHKGDDDGVVYEYPSVLVRQLDIISDDTSVAWPKYDMMVVFNEASEYFFDDDMPLTSRHSYFEKVALHELIHGLGFGVGSLTSPQDANGDTDASLVIPYHETMPHGYTPDTTISIPLNLSDVDLDLRFYQFGRPTIFERFLSRVPGNDTRTSASRSPNKPAFLDFMTKIQARVNQLVKSGTIKPMSAADAKAASDKLDKTPEEKARAANTTLAVFDPKHVHVALATDPEAKALMSAVHTTVTTPSAIHFDFTLWPAIAAQLGSLLPNFNLTSTLPIETSYANFSLKSLSHVQRPQSLIDHDRDQRLGNATRHPQVTDVGPEFIVMSVAPNLPLEELATSLDAPSGIGPKTLASLVALGYTPASAKGWASRKDVAELVREEVPVGTPLGPPSTAQSVVQPEQPKPAVKSAAMAAASFRGELLVRVGMAVVGVFCAGILV